MKIEHKIRTKDGTEVVTLTRKTSIFYFCLECVCWIPSEVEECTNPLCPLYPFRNAKAVKGKSGRTNPKGVESLKKARKKRGKK